MEDPLPVGLGLRVPNPGWIAAGMYVPPPSHHRPAGVPVPQVAPPPPPQDAVVGPDGLVDFDRLTIVQVSEADAVPSIPTHHVLLDESCHRQVD